MPAAPPICAVTAPWSPVYLSTMALAFVVICVSPPLMCPTMIASLPLVDFICVAPVCQYDCTLVTDGSAAISVARLVPAAFTSGESTVPDLACTSTTRLLVPAKFLSMSA